MKYYITSDHDVFEDVYDEGFVGQCANSYEMESIITDIDPANALENYIRNVLGYNFDYDDLSMQDDNILFDVLVDKDSLQPDNDQIKKWQKGKLKLYTDCISFKVYSLTELKKEDFNGRV
jgi:hypothetical protein